MSIKYPKNTVLGADNIQNFPRAQYNKVKEIIDEVNTLSNTSQSVPKVYIARMTQTGTANPVVTVIKNTLGGTVNVIRTGEGMYRISSNELFPLAKTYAHIPGPFLDQYGNQGSGWAPIYHSSDSVMDFTTYMNTGGNIDELLQNTLIKIEVYE